MNKQLVAKELLKIAKNLTASNDELIEKQTCEMIKKATNKVLEAAKMIKRAGDIAERMENWKDSKKIQDALFWYKEAQKSAKLD